MLISLRLHKHDVRQSQRLKRLDMPGQVPLFFCEVPNSVPVRGRWFLSEGRDALDVESGRSVLGFELETAPKLPLGCVPFLGPIGRKAFAELIAQFRLARGKRSFWAEKFVYTHGFALANDRNQIELTAFDFFLGEAQCFLRYDDFRAIDLVGAFEAGGQNSLCHPSR